MSGRSTRLVLSLTALTVLTAPTAPTVAPVAAQAVPAYTLEIDPSGAGPELPRSMYGVFFEDINHAADGGLYAELVRNRSFEFDPADHPSFTGLTAWTPASAGGTARVADDAGRLNERNRRYLRLEVTGQSFGVTNLGYHAGIAIERGKQYDFSVWARGDAALTAGLTDATGTALARPVLVTARAGEWAKYAGSFIARESSTTGRLTVSASASADLDMVSLFPRETYRNRPNGLRRDLAEKIAALEPGFVRFPGGCLVNTGSHHAYAAPDWERRRSYQWKDTIGPVEERATNANFWGYNQSYGLGYFEYFQFAEDIGAMPLPVVPALVTGCGQNQATDDPELLRRHVRDTLDLIEFANGPADSPWGARRAQLGHPEPFGLTHLAVGNEENLPDEFFARFTEFRAAINERHPELTVISNSGPDDAGATFDRLWSLNRAAGVAMVDEHYYNSPQWFLENNNRYDGYDRRGPKVFLGEYASQDNRFANSLAEAAFMTGLERNADVVRLASYAPLLADRDNNQWRPDLIWFSGSASWGSTSYETQKLFMTNVGDRVVPSRASSTPIVSGPITGAVGLSTWATSARYDDVAVTAADGTALFADDFSAGAGKWANIGGRGTWTVDDGSYLQSDVTAENTMVSAGDPGWQNYDLTVKATKQAGAEGFLIGFGVRGSGDYYWWNLGGWGNTRSAVEKATGGAKQTLIENGTRIEQGRIYDVRVEVRDRHVTLFLDGVEWGEFTDDKVAEPFRQVVTRDSATGELIVKVVNAQPAPATTHVDLGGAAIAPRGRAVVLSGAPDAVNTETATPIRPVESIVDGLSAAFEYTFPPHSITFLRLSPLERVPLT